MRAVLLLRQRQAGFVHGSVPRCGKQLASVKRHACAALCLYGQPFGFTQEDVAGLLDFEDEVGPGTFETIKYLAARIAALLPPTQEEKPEP